MIACTPRKAIEAQPRPGHYHRLVKFQLRKASIPRFLLQLRLNSWRDFANPDTALLDLLVAILTLGRGTLHPLEYAGLTSTQRVRLEHWTKNTGLAAPKSPSTCPRETCNSRDRHSIAVQVRRPEESMGHRFRPFQGRRTNCQR